MRWNCPRSCRLVCDQEPAPRPAGPVTTPEAPVEPPPVAGTPSRGHHHPAVVAPAGKSAEVEAVWAWATPGAVVDSSRVTKGHQAEDGPKGAASQSTHFLFLSQDGRPCVNSPRCPVHQTGPGLRMGSGGVGDRSPGTFRHCAAGNGRSRNRTGFRVDGQRWTVRYLNMLS